MAELKGCDFCKFVNYESSDDFYLYEMGSNKCEPSYSYTHTVVKRTIIHFVVSGRGHLVLNGKRFDVLPHQAFIIPEGIPTYYCADDNDPWEYIWFHIGGPKFPQILSEAGVTPENPVFVPTEHAEEIESLARDNLENYSREYYCIGNLYKICDYMREYSVNKKLKESNSTLYYVKTTIAYIQLKYSEPINIEKIAFACGLNRSYLTRLFKKATGYSLQEYLTFYRMKMAVKLLSESDLNIQDIAAAVGYNDSFTFSKAFKRQFEKSPKDYRNSLKQSSPASSV